MYYDIGGKYIGPTRMDDLCDREDCEQCSGEGIAEECERCVQLRDWDEWGQGIVLEAGAA